jgi:hypothetical protein
MPRRDPGLRRDDDSCKPYAKVEVTDKEIMAFVGRKR